MARGGDNSEDTEGAEDAEGEDEDADATNGNVKGAGAADVVDNDANDSDAEGEGQESTAMAAEDGGEEACLGKLSRIMSSAIKVPERPT